MREHDDVVERHGHMERLERRRGGREQPNRSREACRRDVRMNAHPARMRHVERGLDRAVNRRLPTEEVDDRRSVVERVEHAVNPDERALPVGDVDVARARGEGSRHEGVDHRGRFALERELRRLRRRCDRWRRRARAQKDSADTAARLPEEHHGKSAEMPRVVRRFDARALSDCRLVLAREDLAEERANRLVVHLRNRNLRRGSVREHLGLRARPEAKLVGALVCHDREQTVDTRHGESQS